MSNFDNEINIPRADADTPLKALLKLVIALDDAGVKLVDKTTKKGRI